MPDSHEWLDYSCLLKSPEFEQVRVVVKSLPPGEAAEQFLAQFVNKSPGEKVFGGVMYRKKPESCGTGASRSEPV